MHAVTSTLLTCTGHKHKPHTHINHLHHHHTHIHTNKQHKHTHTWTYTNPPIQYTINIHFSSSVFFPFSDRLILISIPPTSTLPYSGPALLVVRDGMIMLKRPSNLALLHSFPVIAVTSFGADRKEEWIALCPACAKTRSSEVKFLFHPPTLAARGDFLDELKRHGEVMTSGLWSLPDSTPDDERFMIDHARVCLAGIKGQCHDNQWFVRFLLREQKIATARASVADIRPWQLRKPREQLHHPSYQSSNCRFLRPCLVAAIIFPTQNGCQNHRLLWHCACRFKCGKCAMANAQQGYSFSQWEVFFLLSSCRAFSTKARGMLIGNSALPWSNTAHLITVIAEIFVCVKILYSSVCRLSYARIFRTATVVSDTLVYVYGFRMLLNFVLSAKSTKYTKLNRVQKCVRLQ